MSKLVDFTCQGDERRPHKGIYGLVSLGQGRKLGKIDCPFCDTVVDCYKWSICGSGKKCKCGAVLYISVAVRSLSK